MLNILARIMPRRKPIVIDVYSRNLQYKIGTYHIGINDPLYKQWKLAKKTNAYMEI